MAIKNYFLFPFFVVFVKLAWCMLPPIVPIQDQTELPTTPQTVQSPFSRIDFDFKGFFDHFAKLYGRNSLVFLQAQIHDRVQADGLTPLSSVPLMAPCATAPAVSGTTLTYSDPQHAHGSLATYTCSVGFKGPDQVLICQNGMWSEPVANMTCTLVTCPKPPLVSNADIHVGQLTHGSQASYTCKPGFQADNIARPITCQATGEWSSPTFRCVNMMALMMNNNAMAAMASSTGMGGGMGGAGGMDSLMAMMGGGGGMGQGGAAGLPQHLQTVMAGVGMGVGGALPMGQQQPALPPHLQAIAGASLMDPNILRSLGGGTLGGAPGAMPGPMGARPPLEPEQMQEQMLMMMMMNQMMGSNQQRQQQQKLQQQKQQEQLLQRQQQLQQQQQQQQQQLQQQQPQPQQQQQSGTHQPTVNLANVLSLGGNPPPPQQPKAVVQPTPQPALPSGSDPMAAIASVVQRLQSGGAAQNTNLMNALNSLAATMKAQKLPLSSVSTGTDSGNTSVFGASSNTSSTVTATEKNPTMDAIMAAAQG